jgi:hypothetical protein
LSGHPRPLVRDQFAAGDARIGGRGPSRHAVLEADLVHAIAKRRDELVLPPVVLTREQDRVRELDALARAAAVHEARIIRAAIDVRSGERRADVAHVIRGEIADRRVVSTPQPVRRVLGRAGVRDRHAVLVCENLHAAVTVPVDLAGLAEQREAVPAPLFQVQLVGGGEPEHVVLEIDAVRRAARLQVLPARERIGDRARAGQRWIGEVRIAAQRVVGAAEIENRRIRLGSQERELERKVARHLMLDRGFDVYGILRAPGTRTA